MPHCASLKLCFILTDRFHTIGVLLIQLQYVQIDYDSFHNSAPCIICHLVGIGQYFAYTTVTYILTMSLSE